MSKIGTMTTGAASADTFNLTFVPQMIGYVAATQITSLKVTVLGDGVICDLDAAGLTALGTIRRFGNVTNGYLINLADGFIKGKNVTIDTVNSAAQTPTLFAISQQKGSIYIQSIRQTALANSGAEFMKFAALAIPAFASTDILSINYVDGFVGAPVDGELEFMASQTQNVASEIIDNFEGYIDKVQITPSADRTVYMMRYSGANVQQAV